MDALVGWYDFAYEGGSFKVCMRPGGKCVAKFADPSIQPSTWLEGLGR
jgi:hypothetical protein